MNSVIMPGGHSSCADPGFPRRTQSDSGELRRVFAVRLAAAVLAATAVPLAAAQPQIYRVDPELTSAEFAVSHLGLSSQHGHFSSTRGTIVLDPEAASGRVDFVVDARSVDTGWTARDDFLRSEDMFDSARYPVVRFRSTQLAFDHTQLIAVAGDLTLHNVTRHVDLKVARLECGSDPASGRDGCGAEVAASIKRSDFGMTYALGLVGDDIDLSFQVTAFRVPDGGEEERP